MWTATAAALPAPLLKALRELPDCVLNERTVLQRLEEHLRAVDGLDDEEEDDEGHAHAVVARAPPADRLQKLHADGTWQFTTPREIAEGEEVYDNMRSEVVTTLRLL